MALILGIDISGETAMVGLGSDDKVLASASHTDQKNHASFIQPAIHNLLLSESLSYAEIDVVCVVNGPGSYTGLRVGLATAKGICYAINKPLILLNTLTVIALAAVEYMKDPEAMYCPVIDARRNEVFTAIYDHSLQSILPPQPMILEPGSFTIYLEKGRVVFSGSGHNKCNSIITNPNAVFKDIPYSMNHIFQLAQTAYQNARFADVAYAEPFYTKDFFTPS